MEGGRWKVDFLHVKETNLGKKKKSKHWWNRREGRRLEDKEEEDDEGEGEDIFFPREFIHPWGIFSSTSFFSFSSVVVVVVVDVVVGLEANSFLVPRSKRREAVTYKHINTHLSPLSLSLRGP